MLRYLLHAVLASETSLVVPLMLAWKRRGIDLFGQVHNVCGSAFSAVYNVIASRGSRSRFVPHGTRTRSRSLPSAIRHVCAILVPLSAILTSHLYCGCG